MRYVVDGYNVTKRDPATARLSLEGQREALVARLAARGQGLLGSGPIVVVFDGVPDAGVGTFRRGSVEVRFSRLETADDLIVRLAEGDGVTVVTSDTGLGIRVGAFGARVLGSDVCFEGRAGKPSPRYRASSAGLPPGANKVTEELKKLWLDDKE
ncbi:MAG: NYN domain-containing protein [Coriobacteriia bacterium]|nr:NYN domain-containing protein [Coriobacteriia bacterium]